MAPSRLLIKTSLRDAKRNGGALARQFSVISFGGDAYFRGPAIPQTPAGYFISTLQERGAAGPQSDSSRIYGF
jgi:hypothetical protein